jgi:transposase-like protein
MGGWSIYGADAEGEVLDVLVQSKRNKHAALKLMRKLLKKYAFAAERLVTDDLHTPQRPAISASSTCMSAPVEEQSG